MTLMLLIEIDWWCQSTRSRACRNMADVISSSFLCRPFWSWPCFPWKYLSKNKIGYWHNLNEKKLFKKRNQLVDKQEKKKFIKNLYKIGYSKNILFNKYKYSKLLITAFQRRFRQELVNGTIDQECLFISNNLAKKLK